MSDQPGPVRSGSFVSVDAQAGIIISRGDGVREAFDFVTKNHTRRSYTMDSLLRA
jgi:hypothetical protein